MTSTHTRFLIVGAGPTGLGAAHRFAQQGENDWLILEAGSAAGGLAGSVTDENGFTWDLGGHVIFSHYDYFDQLLDQVLKDEWLFHTREASVWLDNQFIPYPFQNNIWRLPKETLVHCLDELLSIWKDETPRARAANFQEWLEQNYGQRLCEIFFFPYNRKVWACEPSLMSSVWIGERVARVSVPTIIRNIVLQQDDVGWGPNARFRFPLKGGTGAIWRAVAQRLPKEKIWCDARVKEIDPAFRRLTLEDGRMLTFDHMISTMPLNVLLSGLKDQPELSSKAGAFKYSSVHIVGVGIDAPVPERLANKFWMYFPASELPFYRVTVFSNYSQYNVAKPGQQWSLLCEVSESLSKPVDQATLVQQVVEGLKQAKLLEGQERFATLWHKRLEHGYPTPFLQRDQLLLEVERSLRSWNILSRGRFGGWRYEVANQDHSLMQGVEAADHLLHGTEEVTYFQADTVNAGQKQAIRPVTKKPVAQA